MGNHPLPSAAGYPPDQRYFSNISKRDVSIGLPPIWNVNFAASQVATPDAQRTSPIAALELLDAVLVLQGHQKGHGWTMVIERATGHLSATLADADVPSCSRVPARRVEPRRRRSPDAASRGRFRRAAGRDSNEPDRRSPDHSGRIDRLTEKGEMLPLRRRRRSVPKSGPKARGRPEPD